MKLENSAPDQSSDPILKDEKIFPPFPDGPLTPYRKSATFCYKRMKLILENPDFIRTQHKIWDFMENHPEFKRDSEPKTRDDMIRTANRQQMIIWNENFFTINDHTTNPKLVSAYSNAVAQYDPSVSVKYGLCFGMFPSVILSVGTDRLHKYVKANAAGEILGAFALTEVGHGTNTRGMQTTATYDPRTEEFIIHSPSFEAAKCWPGNLGKTCTHAVVYAQLYTDDGKHHGLNVFLVPIRDTKTLETLPGVIAGDLGPKLGLNGVDNGFVMFNNFRIPRENLLARTGDVTPDGKFVTTFTESGKRMGASLGALSAGRVSICGLAGMYLSKAITIAVRYSAVRRQFGPEDSNEELPVLEYQSQQYRLIPYIAATYAIHIFSSWISDRYIDMRKDEFKGKDISKVAKEIHALSSAAKPVCTWTARDGIQECREACGGHGYLKIAGIGEMRNNIDAACTYEGENNTLIQQASNWLIGLYLQGPNAFKEASVLKSCDFLCDIESILKSKFDKKQLDEVMHPQTILSAMDWLCAWMLKRTIDKFDQLKERKNMTGFDKRNNIQVFFARDLSIVYGQRNIFYAFYTRVFDLPFSAERQILVMLVSFYGAELMIKNSGLFYQGGYFSEVDPVELYKEGILTLLPALKSDSVPLVDALAPPDFILNSALGMSDGNVYKHLQSRMMLAPGAIERPKWWREVIHRDYLKNKL